MTRQYETDEINQETARIIIEGRLDEIHPKERLKVFSLYCTHCGDKQPENNSCRCWDDS